MSCVGKGEGIREGEEREERERRQVDVTERKCRVGRGLRGVHFNIQ